MNNINRNVTSTTAATTFRQQANATKPAIRCNSTQQVPTPEPRGKLSHNHQSMTTTTKITDHRTTTNADDKIDVHGHDFNLNHQQVTAKLVNVEHQQPDVEPIYRETNQHKRTSFNSVPVEFISDEGVGSPTNIDYDDEEEIADEYYDDEEEFEGSSEQTDELKNLSRQSMMPLHELIAYYQYIQQGNSQPTIQRRKGSVSRQSSSASQQTTKTKHSLNEDTIDGESSSSINDCVDVIQSNESVLKTREKDLGTANETFVTKIQVPKIKVDNIEIREGEKLGDEKEKDLEQQQVQAPPLKDKRRIRANVVLELINSERDFVKHLRDVVEGYLYPARRHPEIFTGERISTIFSNIEQLYEFQRKFLDSLESCINWDDLANSEVGNCFLEYEKDFSVYHHYCNNHPNATSELQDLYTKPRFVKFFEACRLLQNMIDISLDGFLLTPIQKICKYPLQLNELLKNTDEDHQDFLCVSNALESMRNCANLANERKRRIEALADVMSFQEKVDNWFGPKLSDTSSILIHSGEVSKMTSHTWYQGVQLYLFDHLLLYSKKDLLKRNNLILKGRICMDTVTEISDGDEYKSKKSFKLYCSEQQKWFVFTTRSEKEKDEWIRAFERERNLVESDENEGFYITEKEIGVARRALQNRKHSRSARYRHKRPDTAIVDQLDIDDANTIMNRTLSLPSCIHPSHVMNFVEDSRVVSSSRKKNTSPTSSSRSPMASNQYLAEIQGDNQTQSSGNWFKKMGSKKLAKSQVYNVNGTGNSSNVARAYQATSPTVVSNVVGVDTSAAKYDQLEKRHRDHMVSEEQARLFRLNNDLPPPLFTTKSVIGPQIISRQATKSPNPQPQQRSQTTTWKFQLPDEIPSGFQSINLSQASSSLTTNQTQESSMARQIPRDQQNESTFEATVVLSSGRVVTVREDAV